MLKVILKTRYKKLLADNEALTNNVINLHTKAENVRREHDERERALLDELRAAKDQIAKLQSYQLMVERIDRDGLLALCQRYDSHIAEIIEERNEFIIKHEATNAIGDHLHLIMRKDGIVCHRLGQLAEYLMPREFPELTAMLKLHLGIEELRCSYLPFHNYWWRRCDEAGTNAVNFHINVLNSDAEYAEDPLGFLLMVKKLAEPKDNARLMLNLDNLIIRRMVWHDGNKQSEPLVFSTQDLDIYVISPSESGKPFDPASSCGNRAKNTSHRWLSKDHDVIEAYKMRWKLPL